MSSTQTAASSRRTNNDLGDFTTLVDLLRVAMHKVDSLPPQKTIKRDNEALTKAMTPANTLFKKIKRASPKSVADVALQLTTIASFSEWLGNTADTAMEDVSPAEFRAIATNLESLLEADRPCSNPPLVVAQETVIAPSKPSLEEAMEGPLAELVLQAELAMTVFDEERLFLRSVEQLERMLIRFQKNFYDEDFSADI